MVRENSSELIRQSVSFSFFNEGFISHGMPKKAIDLFFKIPKVDEVIYTTYFTACAQLGTDEGLVLGKQVEVLQR